ncbi:MAG: hypothetical protein Q613_PSC00345G0001, partial [Propionibacterium sp. DORA_15]
TESKVYSYLVNVEKKPKEEVKLKKVLVICQVIETI